MADFSVNSSDKCIENTPYGKRVPVAKIRSGECSNYRELELRALLSDGAAQRAATKGGPSQNVQPKDLKTAINPNGTQSEDYVGPFVDNLLPTVEDLRKEMSHSAPADKTDTPVAKKLPKALGGNFVPPETKKPATTEPPKAPVAEKPAEPPKTEPKAPPKGTVTVQEEIPAKPASIPEPKAPETEIKISTGPSQNVMPAPSKTPVEDYKGPFKSDLTPKQDAPKPAKTSASAPQVNPAFAKLAKGEAAHLEPEKETPKAPESEIKISTGPSQNVMPAPSKTPVEDYKGPFKSDLTPKYEAPKDEKPSTSAPYARPAFAKLAKGEAAHLGGNTDSKTTPAPAVTAEPTVAPTLDPVVAPDNNQAFTDVTLGAKNTAEARRLTEDRPQVEHPETPPQAPAQPVAPKAKPIGVMDNSIMGQLGGTEGQLLDGATGSTTDTAALVNGQLNKGATDAHDSSKDLEGRAVAPQAPVVTSGTPKPVVEKPATPAPVVEKPAAPVASEPSAPVEQKPPVVDPQQAANEAIEAKKRAAYQAELDAAEARQAEIAKADAARITAARAETERLRLEAQAAKDAKAAKDAPPAQVETPSKPAPKAEDPFKDDPNYLVRGKSRYAKLNIPSAGEDRVYSNLDKPGFMVEHDVKLFGFKLWTSRSNYDVNEMPNLELYEPEKARTDYKYNGIK